MPDDFLAVSETSEESFTNVDRGTDGYFHDTSHPISLRGICLSVVSYKSNNLLRSVRQHARHEPTDDNRPSRAPDAIDATTRGVPGN